MEQPMNSGTGIGRGPGIVEGVRSFFRGVLGWMTERSFCWIDWIALGAYTALIIFGIRHHEPWSDEAYAWVMARDLDLPALLNALFHNYENHPALQHLCLFPFAKLGFPYATQSVLNGVMAVAAVLLFLRKAPIARVTKYFFIFSFYMTFEYALITRPYMPALLLIFGTAAAYPYRFRSPLIYGGLVTLLFNADYIVFSLGTVLLLTYGLEGYLAHRNDRRVLAGFLIMLVAAAWVFKQGVLIPKEHYDVGLNAYFGPGNFFLSMRKALFPHGPLPYIPAWTEPLVTPFCALFFLVALAALLKNATAFLGLFLTLLEFAYLFIFKRGGDLRHFGFLPAIFLFGVWIIRTGEGEWPLDRFWKVPPFFLKETLTKVQIGVLTACLAIGVPFTYSVYVMEYKQTFSGGKEMGGIIRALDSKLRLKERGYEIVTWSPKTTGVAAYLPGMPMWNACMELPIGFYPATKELRTCNELSFAQLMERMGRRYGDLSRVLLLSSFPLPLAKAAGYRFFLIAHSDPITFGYMHETFFLYGIEKESAGAGAV
jgi:hypothetical protein